MSKKQIYFIIPKRRKATYKPRKYSSTRQMLRISCIWPDWNSYVKLGVFHTIFSTNRCHSYFSPKMWVSNSWIRFLTSVGYYYMHPVEMSTPHHIYMYVYPSLSSSAVMLLSDVDFVALNNSHICLMRWHQFRVEVRAMEDQRKNTYGLGCGVRLIFNTPK